MARARRTNVVAAKYQGKWEQFQQKRSSKLQAEGGEVTTNNAPREHPHQLTLVDSSNSSSSRKTPPPSTNTSTTTSSSNNPRRRVVSFHGLKEEQDGQASSAHNKKLSFKTKQESQTKHPKVIVKKENPRQWITNKSLLLAQQQQQQQPSYTSTPTARNTSTTTSRRRPRNSNSNTTTAIAQVHKAPKAPRRMETPSSNNVSVVVRLRPIVTHETERGAKKVVHKVRTMDAILQKKKEEEEVVRVELAPSLTQKGKTKHKELVKCFALDGVLEELDSQETVYKASGAFKAVTQDLFRGFHCTILAYGQSGSGKTYTMGTMASASPTTTTTTSSQSQFQVRGSDCLDEQAGVIQRACHDLFQQVEEQCMGDATVELSYLEIYNEEIRDLLSTKTSKLSHSAALKQQKERERLAQQEGVPLSSNNGSNNNGGLQIREDPSGEVFVQGKTSVAVTNAEQVIELMRLANAKRVVASTKLNQVSSRSHAICILTVTGTNSYDVTFQSRLTLVDLAGSERLSKTENTGWRAKEGININVGLFVLGLVISALTEKRPAHKRHPPYRESKLTRILQNSLGGNARTIMIACCSPTDYHAEETVNTLRYATQARNIENPAVANIVHDEHAEQVLQLQSQNDHLTKTNSSLQEQIAEYQTLIRQISSELSHVKQHYETTTMELCEVKQDYQTTAEQLMEIQEDFKMTVHQMHCDKIEDVLKKQSLRQKKKQHLSGHHHYLYSDVFQDDNDDHDLLLVDPNTTTPTRSVLSSSYYGENSVGTEPTADLTIGTTTAVSPLANRLVPPSSPDLEEEGEAAALVVPKEEEEQDKNVLQEEQDDEDELESVPLSQVAQEECDQSQAISLLTEHQEWNNNADNANNNPLLGELETTTDDHDDSVLSISKAMEQAQESQDLDDQADQLQQQLEQEGNGEEEGSLHSLHSLTTEIHEPLSTNNNNNYLQEEEKKETEQEEEACESSYQKCKTTSKLYCNDSLVDKESEVMVEAVPVSMPYNDLTGVNMPSMSPSNATTATSPRSNMNNNKLEEHSLQSGTITQGSQATGASASNKKSSAFKQFLAKWNCMSGAYGMVQKGTKSRQQQQTPAPAVQRV